MSFREALGIEADKRGLTIEQIAWGIFSGLYRRAQEGDARAAKLLLDRLFGLQTIKAKIATTAPTVVNVITGVPTEGERLMVADATVYDTPLALAPAILSAIDTDYGAVT